MAGAFVAVADDPTAIHWNPAGLIHGPLAGVTIGWDRFHFGNQETLPRPGVGRQEGRLTVVGAWPLGISFGSFKSAWITDASQDGVARVASLRVSQISGTVLQTVAPGIVIGATIKYLRGTPVMVELAGDSAREVLETALSLDGTGRGAVDLDFGVMADAGRFRAGLTVRNVSRPRFVVDTETAIRLPRRVRVGMAAFPADGVTLALDIDLDTADPLVGLRRAVALGAESLVGRRLQVRAGLRWNREEARARTGAVGASVALRRGLWLDGYVIRGGRDEGRGFGFALRAG
jgi:hypothetical protein